MCRFRAPQSGICPAHDVPGAIKLWTSRFRPPFGDKRHYVFRRHPTASKTNASDNKQEIDMKGKSKKPGKGGKKC